MKVIIFGAAGKTGLQVVDQSLAAGHDVTAFVHDADAFRSDHAGVASRVKVSSGDAQDKATVAAAVAGQDAVVDAIGGKTPYKETDLERDAAAAILDGMRAHGVRRLVAVSMMGVGDSTEQTPLWVRLLVKPTFLRGATQDKEAMEEEIRAGGVEFVLVRPPFLSDDPPTGSIKVFEGGETAHKITRGDLARFVVEQLSSDAHLNRAVTIGNS